MFHSSSTIVFALETDCFKSWSQRALPANPYYSFEKNITPSKDKNDVKNHYFHLSIYFMDIQKLNIIFQTWLISIIEYEYLRLPIHHSSSLSLSSTNVRHVSEGQKAAGKVKWSCSFKNVDQTCLDPKFSKVTLSINMLWFFYLARHRTVLKCKSHW